MTTTRERASGENVLDLQLIACSGSVPADASSASTILSQYFQQSIITYGHTIRHRNNGGFGDVR